MKWDVIVKWLPKLLEGAYLTLELVAIAVLVGLLIAIPLLRHATATFREQLESGDIPAPPNQMRIRLGGQLPIDSLDGFCAFVSFAADNLKGFF